MTGKNQAAYELGKMSYEARKLNHDGSYMRSLAHKRWKMRRKPATPNQPRGQVKKP